MPPSLGLPPGTRPVRLPAPHGELAALVTEPHGPRRRTVLLVPGFTGSKEDFLPLLPLLADAGHTVVAVDQRGQFESRGPDDASAYTVASLATELRAVVDDLVAADGPVHLLGHSFGGLVARRAVLRDRTGVASVTLLGSGPAAIGGQRAEVLRLMRPLLDQHGLAAVWEASERLNAADQRQPPQPAHVREFLRRRFFASSAVGLGAMGEALLTEPDLVADLAGTGLPVLVAHGEHDDAWSPTEQREMAERLGAHYVVIADALHSPAAEAPARTADALLAFWADVDRD